MLDQFEQNLEQLSQTVKLEVMPGELELSTAFLPQQPLSKCLFPSLQQNTKNVNFVTNPHSFSINDTTLLGTSG